MPGTEDPVLLDRSGAVAVVRFNRPASLNAVDETTAGAFLDACRSIARSPEVRAVVLRGEGRAFSAGGDVARFRADLGTAAETADAIIRPLHEALALMAEMPQPVIAGLHGAVAGAGLSIALTCDLAIAADDTRFTLANARIGASLDGSSSWFLPRVVGLRKAMEIALLAETFDAAEAARLGLVNRVVPARDLVAETEALAERLAAGPTLAYGRIKRLLRDSFGRSLGEQLEAERAAFCASAATADFAEGVTAFFDKRPPRYEGR